MAIPSGLLSLQTGQCAFTESLFSMAWQVVASTGDVVASGIVSRGVLRLSDLDQVHTQLLQMADGKLAEARAWHQGHSIIGGYSAFDANLILDGWWLENNSLVHSVSGTFPASFADSLTNRINAILSYVLGPPVWAWAESIAPGQLRVKCQPVAGANHYHIYDGDVLLGEVPTAAWNVLSVPAGIYSVRQAAVSAAGIVGVRWQPISVEVMEVAGDIIFVHEDEGPLLETETERKVGILRRFWRWLNDPFGVLE